MHPTVRCFCRVCFSCEQEKQHRREHQGKGGCIRRCIRRCLREMNARAKQCCHYSCHKQTAVNKQGSGMEVDHMLPNKLAWIVGQRGMTRYIREQPGTKGQGALEPHLKIWNRSPPEATRAATASIRSSTYLKRCAKKHEACKHDQLHTAIFQKVHDNHLMPHKLSVTMPDG